MSIICVYLQFGVTYTTSATMKKSRTQGIKNMNPIMVGHFLPPSCSMTQTKVME